MKDCREVQDNLGAWLDGELPAAELLAVEGHLQACPACRAEADALRRVQRAVAAMPLPELPRDLVVDINRAIDADELAARRPARPLWRRPAAMGSLAAAAMVVMMLTYALPALFLNQLSPVLEQEQVAVTAALPDRSVPPAPAPVTGAGDGRTTVELPVREPAPLRQDEVAAVVRPEAERGAETSRARPLPAPVPAAPAVSSAPATRVTAPAPVQVADDLLKASEAAVESSRVAEANRLLAATAATPAVAEGGVSLSAPVPGSGVVSALRNNQARSLNVGGNAVTAMVPVMSLKRLRSHVAPLAVRTSAVAGDSDSVRVTIPLAP